MANEERTDEYTDDIFIHRPDLLSRLPDGHPQGEFMIPLPLDRDFVRRVPKVPGCYFIYLRDTPYYAGMSRTSVRQRLWAHATGRGSKRIKQLLVNDCPLYFEYCPVDAQVDGSPRDIARAEFCFLLLHTGAPLPGNMKLDGISLFPDPTLPKAPSLLEMLSAPMERQPGGSAEGYDAITPAPPN